MHESLKSRLQIAFSLLRECLGDGLWDWRILGTNESGPNVFEFSRLGRRVIGKFHSNGAGERVRLAFERLGQRDFEILSLPLPIAWDVEHEFLLSEPAKGRAVGVAEIRSDAERLARIGRSLRELHESGVDLGPPRGLMDHIGELIEPAPEALLSAFPRHARAIEEILERIAGQGPDEGRVSAVPLHRDFHLRQLFDDGGQICVVDWDLCAQGDPAFDVAYFMTYLKTHCGEGLATRAGERFLAGYDPSDELRERLDLHEDFNYLRRSCRRLRLRDRGWEAEVDWMMRRLHHRLFDRPRQNAPSSS